MFAGASNTLVTGGSFVVHYGGAGAPIDCTDIKLMYG